MSRSLYLDTARIGAILPQCADLLREFTGLLETRGQLPHFDRFLQAGGEAWPQELVEASPLLAAWPGLDALRQRVLELCSIDRPATVLFSSSSRALARIAFRCLLGRSERVLCTDFDWPEYHVMLRQAAAQNGNLTENMQIRTDFHPSGRIPRPNEQIVEQFRKRGCDGALLTPVSNEGEQLRLPLIVDGLAEHGDPPFCIVDGAQQIGHQPVDLGKHFEGIYLGGTHKWLRSGQPLSFAILAWGDDPAEHRAHLRKAIRSCLIDDTLLLQTSDIGLTPPQQTLRIEPLLTAAVAIEHALREDVASLYAIRQQNAYDVWELTGDLLTPYRASTEGGILRWNSRQPVAAEAQRRLAKHGVVVSMLSDYTLRGACPETRLTTQDMHQLERAFGSLTSLEVPEIAGSGYDEDHDFA